MYVMCIWKKKKLLRKMSTIPISFGFQRIIVNLVYEIPTPIGDKEATFSQLECSKFYQYIY